MRRRARWTMAVVALGAGACAIETITPDTPKAVDELSIAPYEVHEECTQLVPGDRLDYRFEAQRPVAFQIYYKDGITFIAPVSRDDVTESSGIFIAPNERRYCLRWESGRQGAIIDYRIRVLRSASPR